MSERRACLLVGQHRSTQRYERLPAEYELRLVARMNELAAVASALWLPADLGAAPRGGLAGEPQADRAAVAPGGASGASTPVERIMGWAPRRMHERHYLRVADEPMHDAIQTLYRDDPICERQEQALRLTAVPTPAAEPSAWLADEAARLERLEQQLGLRAG